MKKLFCLMVGLISLTVMAETYDCTKMGMVAGYIAINEDNVLFVNWGAPGRNIPGKVISRSYGQVVLDFARGRTTVILNPAGAGKFKYDFGIINNAQENYCTLIASRQ